MKYYFLIFILLFGSNLYALDFVDPDSSELYLLNILPNEKFKLSFLSELDGFEINVIGYECDEGIECNNLNKNGPYYYLDLYSKNEGVYEIKINYSVQDNIYEDIRKVYVNYNLIDFDLLYKKEQLYFSLGEITFIIENISDVDVNFNVYSSFSNKIFNNNINLIVPANSKIVKNFDIKNNLLGIINGEIYFVHKEQKFIHEIEINTKYDLNSILKNRFYTFSLINGSLNFVSSVTTMFSTILN